MLKRAFTEIMDDPKPAEEETQKAVNRMRPRGIERAESTLDCGFEQAEPEAECPFSGDWDCFVRKVLD